MGQQAISNRNATLDEKKRRAAGRANTNSPEQRAIKNHAKGAVGGAFGKQGRANRRGAKLGAGGGGGGADPRSGIVNVRPARRKAH
jgi:hypothetical protein